MKKLFLLLIPFLSIFHFGQSIKFVSETSGLPLPKVMVFNNDGNLITSSDIDGIIQRESLNPVQEEYSLVYDNYQIGKLLRTDLNKEIVKLRDRIVDVEPIIIKNNSKAKFVLMKGHFNSYVFVNIKLNSYADGIVTYVFDIKTKKLRDKKVEQYRVFELVNAGEEKKNTSNWDYRSSLEIPDMKTLVNVDDYKSSPTWSHKEVSASNKNVVELRRSKLQEKEISLFGYRIFDSKTSIDLAFEKDSKKSFRDLLEYSDNRKLKLKHKTEENYNQIIIQRNFYPTDLEYSEKGKIDGVKFNVNTSSYKTPYWQNDDFPNLQKVFSNFFKDDLKEVKNSPAK